jgi:TPR repeat protein
VVSQGGLPRLGPRQFNLGTMYARGQGEAQDSRCGFRKAADQGYATGQQRRP